MSVLKVMDQRAGDFKIEWEVGDTEALQNARDAFRDATARGFRAYRVGRKSGRRVGDPITQFDENAEELLLVPPLAGGC